MFALDEAIGIAPHNDFLNCHVTPPQGISVADTDCAHTEVIAHAVHRLCCVDSRLCRSAPTT